MAIVACSTPPGTSGIAIIRLSGKGSLKILSSITVNNKILPKHLSITLVELIDEKKRVFDQAVVAQYLSPNSYTGEELVEISCHGNPLIVSKIIDLCVMAGADLAEPGEFTKKAYLNGKIDLTEAEAVSSVIHSKSLAGVRSGIKNLKGLLSRSIYRTKKVFVECVANIEFNLDISEDELQPNLVEKTLLAVEEEIINLSKYVESFRESRFFQEGASVVLAGPPNAGKSTLFNSLINKNHSIVTKEKGTTRDVLEKNFYIKQLPVLLKDTAGIRDGKSEAEKLGVIKSEEEISSADLVVMFDQKPDKPKDNYVYIFNKIDVNEADGNYDLLISAKKNINIEKLKKRIYLDLVGGFSSSETMLTSKRQKRAVSLALEHAKRASALLNEKNSLELVVEDLNFCINELDKITSKTTKDDVLDAVFSSFCVGK